MKQGLLLIALFVTPLPCLADFAEAAVDYHEGRCEIALETPQPLGNS